VLSMSTEIMLLIPRHYFTRFPAGIMEDRGHAVPWQEESTRRE
jgi:hypothetical protein